MFTGASDLSEAQRDRRTSFLPIQGIDASTCKFVNVGVAFEELFCTPKSPMENPSLRTSRYSDPLSRFRSLYKTFMVDDDSEEEFGHCATDELTGEQGRLR